MYVSLRILYIFQVITTGFRAGGQRRKVFTGEYIKAQKHLIEDHKKAFGTDKLPTGLYPDVGTSRYSQNLPYKDWYTFNCAQRAHYNLIEWAASVLLFLLVAGIYYPTNSAIAGVAWIIGREVYTIGYISKGPSGRTAGAVIADLAALFLFGAAVYGSFQGSGLGKKFF